MDYIHEQNVRPYRIFMDSVGTGKKKKGFYIMKNGKRKYIAGKLVVHKKRVRKPHINKNIIVKVKNANKRVVGDILGSSFNKSQVGKVVQESFKNIQGQINKIGDITNVYNLQKDIGELKNEVSKENEKIDKIQSLVSKVKSGDVEMNKILKYDVAKNIFNDLMLKKDMTLDKALPETFVKFQEYIDQMENKTKESDKKLNETTKKLEDEKKRLEDVNRVLKKTENDLIQKKNEQVELSRKMKIDKQLSDARIRDSEKLVGMKQVQAARKVLPIIKSNPEFKKNLDQLSKELQIKSDDPSLWKPESFSKTFFAKLKDDELYQRVRQLTNKSTAAKDIYGFELYDLEQQYGPLKIEETKEDLPTEEEEVIQPKIGDGKNMLIGLNENQINHVMRTFPENKLKYISTFSYDEFWNYLVKTNDKDFCCIINSNERDNKSIGHWMAFNCDKKSRSLEYNDSYGIGLGRGELEKLQVFANKISPDISLKFKYNSIKQQSDSSDTCGWFAIDFLLLRRLGKLSFEDSTGFSNIRDNEKQMEKLKSNFIFV